MSQIKKWISMVFSQYSSTVKYLFSLISIFLIIQLLRCFLRKNSDHNSIRYKSQKAVKIMGYLFSPIRIAGKILSEYTLNSKNQWKKVVTKYRIEDTQIDPSLAFKLTDNWILFNLRDIVDYKKRRSTKNNLNEAIRKEIEKTDGKVILDSSTLEIIKSPEINTEPNEH